MGRNEATIKFNADVATLNDRLKSSESVFKELRSELRLNAAQMQTATDKIQVLEDRHDILQKQLETSQEKTAALSEKVKVAAEIFGENSNQAQKYRTALNNAKTAEENIRKEIIKCNDQLEAQRESVTDTRNAYDKLTDEISDQENSLRDLKRQYENVVLEQGASSKEAKDLQSEMKNLNSELNESKTKLKSAEQKASQFADSLDDANNSAGDVGGYTMFKDVLSDLISSAVTNAISTISTLSEETRDYRTEIGKLNAAVIDNGYSTEVAMDLYTQFYGVLSDSTTASTTVANLSAIQTSQENLESITHSMIGIWSAYGDSIPLDGLAESINETARVGQVTGNLADALNWAGVNEDLFNEQLMACSDEQERQQLIVDTLAENYDGLADSYLENNENIVAANEANADYQESIANIGAAIEPVSTIITDLKTKAIDKLTPAVETISEKIQSLTTWMGEHETAALIIKAVVIGLTVGFIALGIAMSITGIINGVQKALAMLNVTMLANPVTWVIVGIVALVAAIATLWKNSEEFRNFFINAWANIKGAVSSAVDWISTKWTNLKDAIATAKAWFNEHFVTPIRNAVDKVKGFFKFDWELPKIKKPTFSVTWITEGFWANVGKFFGLPGKPKINISWNAEGAIFNKPVIFPTEYGYQGAGEAGPEAIAPIAKLQYYVAEAIDSKIPRNDFSGIEDTIQNLADRAIYLIVNDQKIAEATASANDKVSGNRINLTKRGLAT